MLVSQRKSTTEKKHQAVYEYFVDLFDKKRIRYDDCIVRTAEMYFYSERTVEDIIRNHQKKA